MTDTPIDPAATPEDDDLPEIAADDAGAQGVAHVLRLLRDELEMAMALCGCRTLEELGPAHLQPRS